VLNGSDDDPFSNVHVRLVSSGLLEHAGGRACALSLVSRQRGEGVTTLCVGLARTIASSGNRVLVVDANPLGTRVPQMIGIAAEPLPPSADRVPDLAAVQQAIAKADAQGFDVLVLSDADLANARSAAVWNGIRERYDVVVVDGGSLESDVPHRWRGAVDNTLLVMDPERATYEALERFKSDLDHFSLRLSGFIMNRRTFPVPAMVYRLAR